MFICSPVSVTELNHVSSPPRPLFHFCLLRSGCLGIGTPPWLACSGPWWPSSSGGCRVGGQASRGSPLPLLLCVMNRRVQTAGAGTEGCVACKLERAGKSKHCFMLAPLSINVPPGVETPSARRASPSSSSAAFRRRPSRSCQSRRGRARRAARRTAGKMRPGRPRWKPCGKASAKSYHRTPKPWTAHVRNVRD